MRRTLGSLLGLLVLAAVTVPARAANPKLELKLENVTAQEAAAALSKATDLRIMLQEFPLPEGRPRPPFLQKLEEKASFDWRGVRLADALRQLVARYQLRCMADPGAGYRLYATAAPAPAPAAAGKPFRLAEKQGVRLSVQSLRVTVDRQMSFEAGAPVPGGSTQMQLQLLVEMADGEVETLAGFQNVTARDDQGNFLVANSDLTPLRAMTFGEAYPDRARISLLLTGPHPRAKKLQWIEGDLFGFGVHRRHVLEVPLPISETDTPRRLGGLRISSLRYEGGTGDGAAGTVRMILRLPAGFDPFHLLRDAGISTELVGASGRRFSPNGMSSSGREDGDGATYDLRHQFSRLTEPVTKLVLRWVQREEPKRLLTFRFTDIPLPPEEAFVARRQAPPAAAGAAAAPPERPFREHGGGALLTRVEIGGRPVSGGTLSMGLAVRVDGEWGGTRWLEIDVDESGTARLEELKPGSYRVRRFYTPKERGSLTGGGRWQNAEVEVTVKPGEEIALPPLRWEAEGSRPGGGSRPAPSSPPPAPRRPAPGGTKRTP